MANSSDRVELTRAEAMALREALESYMRLAYDEAMGYREYAALWNFADKALVPLRGGPMSAANRAEAAPLPDPLADGR